MDILHCMYTIICIYLVSVECEMFLGVDLCCSLGFYLIFSLEAFYTHRQKITEKRRLVNYWSLKMLNCSAHVKAQASLKHVHCAICYQCHKFTTPYRPRTPQAYSVATYLSYHPSMVALSLLLITNYLTAPQG